MRLNLGVGREGLQSWVNVDITPRMCVDTVWDLDVTPWPWADCEATEIKAFDILEHLDDMVAVMDECWRVLKPGGLMTVRVPVAGGPNHYDDPTHKRGFTPASFNYWCPNTQEHDPYPLLYGRGTWELEGCHTEWANLLFTLRRLP